MADELTSLHPHEREALEKINSLYEEIERIYNEAFYENPVRDDGVINFHTEGHNLKHCTRWGLRATEELLDLPDEVADASTSDEDEA